MSGATNTNVQSGNSSPSLTTRLKSKAAGLIDTVRGDTNQDPDPDRRAFLRKTGAAGVAAAAGTAASSGEAAALGGKCDISRTDDRNLPWNTPTGDDIDYGGWGGSDYWGTASGADQTPVVFVHGNLNDACNWNTIAEYLESEGWKGDELWAITFREGTSDHLEMGRQLDEFVQHVISETGKSQVHIVSHSLGVTGTRKWMQDYERHNLVDTYIGMAGANHGVCVCPGCYDTTLGADYSGILGAGEACQFMAAQCFGVPGHPLYELNLPDETPGENVDYYTTRGLYDGLYWCNVFSPYLDDAQNDYFYTDHTGQLDQDDEIKERLPEDGNTGSSDDGSDDGGSSWYGWW